MAMGRDARRGPFWVEKLAALAVAGLLLLAGPPLLPQLFPAERAEAATSLSVGGRRMTCGLGKIVVDNQMPALGRARPSLRELYINMRLLGRYPAAFQQFVFLHECAHMTIVDETAADCWAIQRGRYRGLFSKRSVDQICKSLWNTPAGRFHFAGPDRCQHLNACWAGASGR
ncbi:MAG: hypothetical protein GC150_02355 [Rhizobiales bacterium]|nr:hypothetical protein [Hyphomicrobiales bacterium]